MAMAGLICACMAETKAQNLPSIQTDRPDQTESPAIVPKNHFQMENGFSFERESDEVKNIVSPSSLFKYGLNDRFELRLITEYSSTEYGNQKISGLNPVTVGFKTKINEEKGLIPLTSFIGHLTIAQLATEELKSDYIAPSFRFTMQHTLSDKFTLGYNLGAEWDGESAEPVFIYTLTTGYSISEKTGSYIEVYGFAPEYSTADHRFDGGITYLVKQNIQLDVSGGAGISDNAPEYYAALGFSFRLND